MMSKYYDIRFDFDGGIRDDDGNYIPDPPHVYITENGSDVIEVLEDPTPFEDPPNDDTNWEAGPLAQKLLRLLRENL